MGMSKRIKQTIKDETGKRSDIMVAECRVQRQQRRRRDRH